MRRWLRSAGQVLAMLALEVTFLVVLYWSGPYLGSVPFHGLGSWLAQTASQEALTAIARLVCLVAGWWLLASTVGYLCAAALRRHGRSAGRGWRFVSLPVVRKLVEGALGLSMLASTIAANAAGASAATMRPAVVQTLRPVRHAAPLRMTTSDTARRQPGEPAARGPHDGPVDVIAKVSATAPTGTRRHLAHPGFLEHTSPALGSATPNRLAPSADNGFAGLPAGTKVHVVVPGDCLSVIAERYLGDWRGDTAIYELNAGHVQGNGHALTDAHWIYPGWVLVLPANAAGATIVGGAPAPPQSATARTPPAPPAAPAPRTSAPAAAPSAPTAAPSASAGTGPVASKPDPTTTPSPPTMISLSASRDPNHGTADTGTIIEAGLVGAAVLSTIGVLRRRQSQQRPPGRRIRLPGRTAADTELVLRRTETPDRMPLLERALESLVTRLREQATAPPSILGAIVDDDAVEVLLDRPATPPVPWTAASEGFRWRIRSAEVPTEHPEESAPLPALASLGRVAAGRGDALINLEAAGLVGITGDSVRAVGLLYALATHLIGAPWARAVNLILVAFPPRLATTDNVRAVASLQEVAHELQATAEVMATTARQNGCPDAFTGRVRGLAGDGWPPVVVLAAAPLGADDLQLLASVARPGAGVAAVVVNAGDVARWEIDVDAQPCPVNPLRLAVEPTVLDAATVAAIATLIQVAQDRSGATLDDPPYDRLDVSVERPSSEAVADTTSNEGRNHATAPAAERSLTQRLSRANGSTPLPDLDHPPILVRVLGSVEVEGASEFKRAKSRELLVYLAMHPNGVGESELDEALWGSNGTRVIVSSTRDATVSVARTAVGGAARLLPAQGQGREKRYQLGPEVQSDWTQFCVLHRFGRQHRSPAALRQALEMVRGRPFEAVVSGRTYGWIHMEGHCRHIEAEVADAADLAAGLFLEAGDPLSARWATRRGLTAEPYTERLWVRLMEAADALGESQEIEHLMDEMDVVLELEGDFTSLHPNTLAAYNQFSRRRGVRSGSRRTPGDPEVRGRSSRTG